MAGYRMFEKQADGSFIELTHIRQVQGFDSGGNAVYADLHIENIGYQDAFLTPLAPAIFGSSGMVTRTSAKIDWSLPDNTGRPAITQARVYRNGTQIAALDPAVLTYTDTGLPTATPELVFTYTVAMVNADGVGELSNATSLQWTGVTSQLPTAPTGLVRNGLTSTQATLSWTETADASVTKHGLFEGAVLVKDNLSATSTNYTWTGLAPGSRHTNVSIKRANSAGWSPASNQITFTTTALSSVVHDVVMGVPDNDEAGDLQYQSWPAARVYSFSGAKSTAAKWGCRVIGLTDSGSSITGQDATATAFQNFLEDFYYGTGSAARTGIEIHFALGNEVDKNAPYTSGTLPATFIETYRLCYNVSRTLNGDGTRRYPLASMWVDLTQHQIKINGSGPRFKAIAQYLDGMACSMYPPGRQSQPVVFTDYKAYCDPVFAVLADWVATYPQVKGFATWEFGIPIDHANQTGTANNGTNGEPTAQTNFSIRPRYATGGIDSAGTNWVGFLQYVYNAVDALGVSMREQCYWNQQSNDVIPNRFIHDKNPRTTPDTEHAWHNWTPGTRLPNG